MQRLLLPGSDCLKLKEVFGLDDVNKLPIVYNIAWYEQKAVIVLLALLYLGVKNIHLGPTCLPSCPPTYQRSGEELRHRWHRLCGRRYEPVLRRLRWPYMTPVSVPAPGLPCPRFAQCEPCIAFHHSSKKYPLTACEQLARKAEKQAKK